MLSFCSVRNFFRICGYDLDFCVWIVQVFDDKVRVVRPCFVHEKGMNALLPTFRFFQLQITIITNGSYILTSNMTVMMYFIVVFSKFTFACRTNRGSVMRESLSVG